MAILEQVEIGDPIKASTINGIIDELAAVASSSSDSGVPNASFEEDIDSNDIPDGWDVATTGSSSTELDTINFLGGTQSFKANITAGADQVTLTTTDFLVGGIKQIGFYADFFHNAATGTHFFLQMQVLTYNENQTFLSEHTVYDDIYFNDGEWFRVGGKAYVDCNFYKLRFIIGDPASGTAWYMNIDDVENTESNNQFDVHSAAGGAANSSGIVMEGMVYTGPTRIIEADVNVLTHTGTNSVVLKTGVLTLSTDSITDTGIMTISGFNLAAAVGWIRLQILVDSDAASSCSVSFAEPDIKFD